MRAVYVLGTSLAATTALATGCIAGKTVPPPGEPVEIAPSSLRMDAPPPSSGRGRLVLDTVGTTATAFEIVEKKDDPDGRVVTPLCETPCAVNLARGKHQLAFVSPRGQVARETVEVFAQPSVSRVALGYVETHPVLWYSGALSACAGAVGLMLGFVLVGQGDAPDRDPGAVRTAHETGGAVLAASTGLLGAAWLLLHLGRTEIQASRMTSFPEPPPR